MLSMSVMCFVLFQDFHVSWGAYVYELALIMMGMCKNEVACVIFLFFIEI